MPVAIRDLASRLRALPVVTLAPPDDALLRALIVKLAADRQLALDEALVNYLANRIERSFAAARAAVARLDEEAMRQHRPVTRALAAELFRDSLTQLCRHRLTGPAVRARTVIQPPCLPARAVNLSGDFSIWQIAHKLLHQVEEIAPAVGTGAAR